MRSVIVSTTLALATSVHAQPTPTPTSTPRVPVPCDKAYPLIKGVSAPCDGDLVPSLRLVALLAAAECSDYRIDLDQCKQDAASDAAACSKKLETLQTAYIACEKKPPVIVREARPITFFERPAVVLTIGVLLGGAVTYAAIELAR